MTAQRPSAPSPRLASRPRDLACQAGKAKEVVIPDPDFKLPGALLALGGLSLAADK